MEPQPAPHIRDRYTAHTLPLLESHKHLLKYRFLHKEVRLAVITAILRFISYLYHGLLALVLLALGTVLTIAGAGDRVRLTMLPWTGSTAVWAVLLGGIFGLLTVILAIRGKLRPLFFLWALWRNPKRVLAEIAIDGAQIVIGGLVGAVFGGGGGGGGSSFSGGGGSSGGGGASGSW